MTTDCTCSDDAFRNGSAFCERHQCVKSAHMHTLCRSKSRYFAAWERDRGPGQAYPPRRLMIVVLAETPSRKRDGLRAFFRAIARGRPETGTGTPGDGWECLLDEVPHDGPGRVWRGAVEDVTFATGEPVELQLALDDGRYTLEPLSEATWPFDGVGLAEGPHDPAYEWLQWRHPLSRSFGPLRLRDCPDAPTLVAVLTEAPPA